MIFKLCIKDILHDWLLSVCLVLAIASIIAPLLILFGLKAGIIQTMRGRLVQDPVNREIRPISAHRFSKEWFQQIRSNNSAVSFVIPMTRQISTSVTATGKKNKRSVLSLLVTGTGDPLLVENGAVIPGKGQCVLTERAAAAIDAETGDYITITVNRFMHGRQESDSLKIQVTGVLDSRASALKAAFVSMDILEAVEAFKDGRAVPAYGWKGELPVAYSVFDGAVILTPHPLSRLEQILLITNTGFAKGLSLMPSQAASVLGFKPEERWSVYMVKVNRRAASEESILAVRHKLRGKNAIVLPWIKPVDAILLDPEERHLYNVKIFAIGKEAAAIIDTGPLFTGGDRRILIPPELMSDKRFDLMIKETSGTVRLPVRVDTSPILAETERIFVSAQLAGQLNLLRYRNVTYDPSADVLLLSRRGYAGFRMYASTIDQVEEIEKMLEEQGITVHTEKQRIAEVRRLDSYLSLIFWLIAIVGVTGGIAALTASLYASVERKKKELNMLRLLGFLKREIVMFPVLQGMVLSVCGLIFAGGIFSLVSLVINHLFRSHLRASESLCTLTPLHILILVGGLIACSVASATLAALQAVRLDPAEALRDE